MVSRWRLILKGKIKNVSRRKKLMEQQEEAGRKGPRVEGSAWRDRTEKPRPEE